MKREGRILIAFLLNLFFAIFELIGGIFSKSVSILSDALHDAGDALSIGISYFLEKKSKNAANHKYTYGYKRYSILGAFITTVILIVGSTIVILSGVKRLLNPIAVNYNNMIILAIIGIVVNFIATYITYDSNNLNEKAVNLHMFEDVLNWAVVLIGAFIIKFTNFYIIDALMCIGVALFIFIAACQNFKKIIDLFLEISPLDTNEIIKSLLKIKGVKGVHHIHLWSIDGEDVLATMHIVSDFKDYKIVKNKVKNKLQEFGIKHVTIEMEEEIDNCEDVNCGVNS